MSTKVNHTRTIYKNNSLLTYPSEQKAYKNATKTYATKTQKITKK